MPDKDKMSMPDRHTQNQRLIILVKENPMIYDSNMPRDNQMLRNSWASIAAAMGDDRVNAEGWKTKWKTIKDSYVRRKRQETGGKRKHHVNGMLTFLDKHIINRRRKMRRLLLKVKPQEDGSEEYDSEAGCLVDVSSIDRSSALKRETDGDGSESGALVGNSDNERSADAGECHDDEMDLNLMVEEHGSEDRGKMGKDQNSLEGEWDEGSESFMDNPKFFQKCRESSSLEDPDGNDSFFRSCSRRMNNLPQPAQSLLRLQITQLFFNIENPDIPDVEITTFPQARTSNGGSSHRILMHS